MLNNVVIVMALLLLSLLLLLSSSIPNNSVVLESPDLHVIHVDDIMHTALEQSWWTIEGARGESTRVQRNVKWSLVGLQGVVVSWIHVVPVV